MRKKKVSETNQLDETIRMFVKFSNYLLRLSTERETSLKKRDYENLLKIAVDNLSFVHSGSVLMVDDNDEFYYLATYNHNNELLKNVKFNKQEMSVRRFRQIYIIKKRSLDLIKDKPAKAKEEDSSTNQEISSIDKVKAFISIPIRVRRKVVGFFNLDTWYDDDIFEKKNFQPIAEMMSKLISISAERFELIKTIKEQNEQISKNLLMDTLTRLPNLKALGNYFDRYVELANRSLNTLYVLYICIENFEQINTMYDPDFGDNLIKKITRLLGNLVRKSDILARIEKYDFAVVTLSRELPRPLINRLYEGMNNFSKKAGIDLDVSIGLAEYGTDSKELDGLLKRAKERTYIARSSERLVE